MKSLLLPIFLLALIFGMAQQIILKQLKTVERGENRSRQRELTSFLSLNNQTKKGERKLHPSARKLSDNDSLANTQVMMLNMKRESELRSLESVINEIGDHVEEINDTVRSKTREFMDTVDRIRNARNSRPNVVKLSKS